MSKSKKNIDILIIGAGPAGLAAGIYASRLKLSTLILEDEIVGGQIRNAYMVENYPGFVSISGTELVKKMNEQAIASGAEIDEFDKILSVKLTDNEKIIETESYIYDAKTVIIAAGSKKRELPIPEERKFHGKSIHYCELCDGHIYEGKHIAVVGGGNSALLAVKFLSKYAKKITIIQQFDYFQAEKTVQDEIFNNPKVDILWNSEVRHALGEDTLSKLLIENIQTKETSELAIDGVFVYIGFVPKTDMYKEYITLDKYGNILAGESTETNIKGVFAAGDVRSKLFRQVTTAVSDGTVAALMAEKFINSIEELSIMVKVYSTTNCPWCEKVKRYLDSRGVAYEDINIQYDILGRRELLSLTDEQSVPVVSVDGKFVLGFEKEKLDNLLNV